MWCGSTTFNHLAVIFLIFWFFRTLELKDACAITQIHTEEFLTNLISITTTNPSFWEKGIGCCSYYGKSYVGEWLNGKRHGKGTCTYFSRVNKNIVEGIYYGDWVDDLREGQGIYQFLDGTVYDGNWNQSEICGKGKPFLHPPVGTKHPLPPLGHGAGRLGPVPSSPVVLPLTSCEPSSQNTTSGG
jgi:hypothetical protein